MPLSTDDVIVAALATLDEVGLVDLTMRRLGDVLGVRAGAIYYHVPNKQTLLALIADRILTAVPPPAGERREALRQWASHLRGALLSHRDSADIVFSARAMGLLRTDPVRRAAALLARDGLPEAEAHGVAATLLTFVLGHVVEEQTRELWERFGTQDRARPAASDARTFEIGVGVILDGVDARFRSGLTTHSPPPQA